jgi:hypothetical protein
MNHNTDTPEEDLPQDGQISQAYQSLDKETTPTALDDRILAAARHEAGSRPQKISFSRRWAVPVSVAAVIVLSVSLFITQRVPVAPPIEPVQEPTGVSRYSASPEEEQEIKADVVERKKIESLSTQRSATKPMDSDSADSVKQQAKDNTVGGVIMLEATPALTKEKTLAPAPASAPRETPGMAEQLAIIRQLLKEGKREEAIAALKTFHTQYPDYPLSDDLKNLLK